MRSRRTNLRAGVGGANYVEALLIGAPAEKETAARVAGAWIRQAHPLPDNQWKVTAARTLVERAVRAALFED